MVTPSIGTVVLVLFPFSDLSYSKLRPVLIINIYYLKNNNTPSIHFLVLVLFLYYVVKNAY